MTKPKSQAQADPGAEPEQHPRVRRQRADARRNVEALMTAARQAFAERGVDASLDDIAKRAGVGAGTLYRHFPTRQALIEAVYRDGIEGLAREGERLAASEPAGQALVDWLRAYTSYVVEKKGLAKSLVSTLDNRAEVFAYAHRRVQEVGGGLFDAAKDARALRDDIEFADVIRLANAIALGCEATPGGGKEQSARLLGLAIEGLRPK